MNVLTVSTWEEYQQKVKALRDQIQAACPPGRYIQPLLFRGQGTNTWGLDTTLERHTKDSVSVIEYFEKLAFLKHRIEAFTDRAWEFDREKALKWSGALPRDLIPGYEFMVFLRHHGFPSPLLDWSESPQVAAFFAFRQPPREAEHVSVFVYCATMDGMRSASSNEPSIHTYGPNIKGHPRHFLQQSSYTICTVFKGTTQYFAPHAHVEKSLSSHPAQDLLWRIDIPVSERKKVLAALGEYNLNAFSLLTSTESLLETLALQVFTE